MTTPRQNSGNAPTGLFFRASELYENADVLFDTQISESDLVTAKAGAEAALSTELSLVFIVRNTYDNTPDPDRKKNDISTITAIKVALSKEKQLSIFSRAALVHRSIGAVYKRSELEQSTRLKTKY